MKEKHAVLLMWILFILIFGSLISIFIVWFNEPNLTNMQMIIKYWEIYVLLVSAGIGLNILKYIKIK